MAHGRMGRRGRGRIKVVEAEIEPESGSGSRKEVDPKARVKSVVAPIVIQHCLVRQYIYVSKSYHKTIKCTLLPTCT